MSTIESPMDELLGQYLDTKRQMLADVDSACQYVAQQQGIDKVTYDPDRDLFVLHVPASGALLTVLPEGYTRVLMFHEVFFTNLLRQPGAA